MTEATTVKKETQKVDAAASKASSVVKGEFVAVVQVRGLVGVNKKTRDTLRMLGLNRVNQCVILKNTTSLQGMLKRVKDYATYGPISKDVIAKIVAARGVEYTGREQDSKGKYTYSCFEFDGKKYKKCFRLNPPRKGYGRAGIKRSFTNGGALGNRQDKIADLVERML